MKIHGILLLFLTSFYALSAQAQDTTEVKVGTDTLKNEVAKTAFYFSGGYLYSFRQFEDQSAYNSYYRWNDQEAIQNSSWNLGVLIPFNKYLSLDLGLNYAVMGEQYHYVDQNTDSTFNFTKKYRQLGVPFRLRLTLGSGKIKGFTHVGVIATKKTALKYESDYTTAEGSPVTNETETISNNIAGFGLSANVAMGVMYENGDFGLMLYPEGRYYLTNSYEGLLLSHHLWGLGLNLGMQLKF